MKKSGKMIRVEPMDTILAKEFLECATIFQRDGWFEFFQRINGFILELSYRFAQGVDKNTVSFETLKFELTRDLIEEATCIEGEGEFWYMKIPFTFNSKDFLLPEVGTID